MTGYSTNPEGDLVIPSTVTISGTTYTVTSIRREAFYGCAGLTSVTFEGTTPPTIGDGVFESCDNLANIYVPAGTGDAYKAALGASYASLVTEMAAPVAPVVEETGVFADVIIPAISLVLVVAMIVVAVKKKRLGAI